MNCFMRFMPLLLRSFQLMLLILSLYMAHAHYNELEAIYAFNSQPSQCLYYVIIRNLWFGLVYQPARNSWFDVSNFLPGLQCCVCR